MSFSAFLWYNLVAGMLQGLAEVDFASLHTAGAGADSQSPAPPDLNPQYALRESISARAKTLRSCYSSPAEQDWIQHSQRLI